MPSKHETLRFHPKFTAPAIGTILRTSDGLCFRADTNILVGRSSFFQELLASPNTSRDPNHSLQSQNHSLLVVTLDSVDSVTLTFALEALHSRVHRLAPPFPPYLTVPFLDQCLLLNDEYDLPILPVLYRSLELHAKNQPGVIFVLAVRLGYEDATKWACELFQRPEEFGDSWWSSNLHKENRPIFLLLVECMVRWNRGYSQLLEFIAMNANYRFSPKCHSDSPCGVVRHYRADFGLFLDEHLPCLWPLSQRSEATVFPWADTRERMEIPCAACRTHLGQLLLRAWRAGHYPSKVEFQFK
ncbi:uncharacterized protein EHS24_000443 [Apiotrichum porosum]|uniref:BTB domain-containing protein n=1 Tax=Apiotrichum porosum TaxID=105984 RepID=A0A427Y9Z0_9TREE|nr:uncharacterized protein EHS24_000443 [Apiotrichum porosum]RSH87923.1 hypothetical protein EHS24_000443 [Apiotrichum porosum]